MLWFSVGNQTKTSSRFGSITRIIIIISCDKTYDCTSDGYVIHGDQEWYRTATILEQFENMLYP